MAKPNQTTPKKRTISKARRAEILAKRREVEKALSPEEETMVSNIKSSLDELLAMGSTEVMNAEVDIEEDEDMVMKEAEAEEDEDMEVNKGLESTESESETASDDAEERIAGTLTVESEKNVDEVAKAVLNQLLNRTTAGVKKSKPVNKTLEAIAQMVEVQKSTQAQINELSTAFAHVLEGTGVLKQMEVTKSKAPKKKVVKSSVDAGNQEIVNALLTALSGQPQSVEKEKFGGNSRKIKKSLSNRDLLTGLLG